MPSQCQTSIGKTLLWKFTNTFHMNNRTNPFDLLIGFVIYLLLIFIVLLAMSCLQPMHCDVGLGIIPAMFIGIPLLSLYTSLHPFLGYYAGLVSTIFAASIMLLLTKILVKSSNYVRISSILSLLVLILLSRM